MVKQPVILIGTGGHARVLLDILIKEAWPIIGLTDPKPCKNFDSQLYFNIPLIGSDEAILKYSPDSIYLVNGLGMIPGPNLLRRMMLYKKFKAFGYNFLTVVHPSAILAANITLMEGVQIMAGAVIQTGVSISENCIINTRAVVDHDTVIGSHVHLAPGTTVSGSVNIGDFTFVGANSTIIQGIQIGTNCIIGAGSVVTRNVPENISVMGIPARSIQITHP